jgi:hypothetical protein
VFVLLKRTYLAPKELPTYMYVTTLRTLKACQQARDPGSAEGLDSRFPNGTLVFR